MHPQKAIKLLWFIIMKEQTHISILNCVDRRKPSICNVLPTRAQSTHIKMPPSNGAGAPAHSHPIIDDNTRLHT